MAWRGVPSYLLIGLVCGLVFGNSLSNDFTFDDSSAIVSNRHVHTNDTDWLSVWWVDYWGTPIQSEHSHKSYRPLTTLTFRLNFLFSGLNAWSYHATNVLLHALVSCILYRLMLNVLNDYAPSLLLTLWFAVHPVKCDAVASIVGRAELLSTFFFLMALFCFFDNSLGCFFIYTILATLSKEQGLTVPCVCIVLELIKLYHHYRSLHTLSKWSQLVRTVQHSSFLTVILLGAFTLVLGTLRFWVMGSLPVFTKFDNPASFEETPTRQLTYNHLLFLNAYLVLYPKLLCADWSMNAIPLVRSWNDTRNYQTLALYLVLLGLFSRALSQLYRIEKIKCIKGASYNQKVGLSLGVCLTVIPFIPASNLLYPVGFVIAERVQYCPQIGVSLILAIGFIRIRDLVNRKWFTFLLYAFVSLALVGYATRTFLRNRDWENDFTLFSSGIKVNPTGKHFSNVGHFFERNQEYEKAIEYFKQATLLDSEDIGAELNIARALIHLNRLDEAEALLWRIKPRVRDSAIRNRIVPHYLNLWINLARVISMNNSRLNEAEKLYREVISIRRDFIDAYINLGEIYIRRLQYDEAIDIYRDALHRAEYKNDLKAADLYYNIAIATLLGAKAAQDSQVQGEESDIVLDEIASNLVSAININANHKEALINLAILVQKRHFDNRTHYREFVLDALRAYTKDEERDVIEFNTAITLLDLGGPSNRLEAITHLKNAVDRKPDFRSALYNLALLYYDFKDYDSSLQYLEQLNNYHSNYTKALLLMADIYSKLRRINLAEKTYIKVLEADSKNNEALHNLYAIYKSINRLDQFEKYLPRLDNASRP